ncbi:DUF4174 domain-containing protein [Mycolicibacterium gadium]|uniref:DUF4174 domain-containing protein n=1 Tax=Mycolicibacterium gadium TaxID=1794 RepID=A0ABT6GXZ8_MYCGU|nr:DUF4174 domain-containing protein [Mycolicibacterium gadium]MDG5486062.1 DUF4174 domain-containing protein [Mycolicibacterium gadium]
MTMVAKRGVRQLALLLIVLVTSTFLGSATAAAAELDDYLWERRPLLVFAPTDRDPRLVETLSRIESSRCDFGDRDMVLGLMVNEGSSTLDGQEVNPDEAQRLRDQYAIGESAFSVLLIGKDGGQKLRVDEVPDLSAIYDLIDGMPMRSRETSANPSRC